MTTPDGQRILPRDVELPGDPLPLRRHLAQLRLERTRRETEAQREAERQRDDGGDDP